MMPAASIAATSSVVRSSTRISIDFSETNPTMATKIACSEVPLESLLPSTGSGPNVSGYEERRGGRNVRDHNDALRLGPREEDLRGLRAESRGDLLQRLVHRASRLTSERAAARDVRHLVSFEREELYGTAPYVRTL